MSADGVVARGLESSQVGPGRDNRVEMMMEVGEGMAGLRGRAGGAETYFIHRNPS